MCWVKVVSVKFTRGPFSLLARCSLFFLYFIANQKLINPINIHIILHFVFIPATMFDSPSVGIWGQVVAVKQLDRNAVLGDKDFLVEVAKLSHLQHPNLVSFIGYCADGDQRLLIYEFMQEGSVEDHLQGIYIYIYINFSFCLFIFINVSAFEKCNFRQKGSRKAIRVDSQDENSIRGSSRSRVFA